MITIPIAPEVDLHTPKISAVNHLELDRFAKELPQEVR